MDKRTTKQRIEASMIPQFRINTLEQLEDAFEQKRAVVFNIGIRDQRPIPAVVFMNMAGTIIARRLKRGTYIYRRFK